MEGRIEGRKSADGTAYEIVQFGRVLKSIPIDDVGQDKKLALSIKRNRWEDIE